MKPRVSPELASIVEAVEILSPTRLQVGERMRQIGGPDPLFVPSLSYPGAAVAPKEALRSALTDELYCWFYARASAASPPPPDLGAHRDHLLALAAANRSSSSWEPGWRVRALEADGRVAVENYGVVFMAAADEVRPENGELAAGAGCRVRVPAEMRTMRPGFYSATGEADAAAPTELSWRVRLYWHLRPAGASIWVRTVTGGLNKRGVPFQMKVVADPRFYLRADAGVLTLEPEHYRAARPVIRRAYCEVRAQLRPAVPAMTFEMAPGLGVAEGAPDGSSFGAHRCGLIAEALVGLGPGAPDAATRHEAVAASFRAAGLDPAKPHRAPGSTTRYRPLARSDLVSGTAAPAAHAAASPVSATAKPADPVAAARRIGDRLCRGAFRDGGRSNWLGRVFVGGSLAPAVGALGANLYGGTAGIALFLAELYAVTGDPDHRATALGAIRQALTAVEIEPDRSRPVSFFEGQLGIGWAARQVAALCADESLAAEAADLISSIAGDLPGERRWDLLEGDAGAILAFLRLYEETGEWVLLEAATRLGRELAPSALGLGTLSGGPGQPPLTGFAHGTAGIGLALLELSAVIGDAGLRGAADRCFAYEESCFDPARGNWPDYRGIAFDDSGVPMQPPGFMTAWCHGAPGIALSRLRAIEIDPERAPSYEETARTGLRATAEAIESGLAGAATEACLCHGLAGLADIARIGARVLGDPALEQQAMSAMERLAVLTSGKQRHATAKVRPDDPTLLTGDAGVGYALLRFNDPERVATVLLPGALRAVAPGLPEDLRNECTPGGHENTGSRLEHRTP